MLPLMFMSRTHPRHRRQATALATGAILLLIIAAQSEASKPPDWQHTVPLTATAWERIPAESETPLPAFFHQELLPDHPFAPCATWENGGLTWEFVPQEGGEGFWATAVWRPVWSFCGFPEPYPKLPVGRRLSIQPRAWQEWRATHATNPTAESDQAP